MASDIAMPSAAVQDDCLDAKLGHTYSSKPSVSTPVTIQTGEVVENIVGIDKASLRKLKIWNSLPPNTIESCVHDLIHERCCNQPNKVAVTAWNGDFTYGEFDALSSSIAAYLSKHGVGLEDFVPIYYEKSRWTMVVMIGVLKAGAAFVLLDPAHPVQRLQEICRIQKAEVLVSSSHYETAASALGPPVLTIDDNTTDWRGLSPGPSLQVKPSNAAYAIFTSGTSGTPKGVVIEHESFCTGSAAHSAAFHLEPSSRVLQFASYAFDACLSEMMSTLIVGGTVCIPSETDRKRDLAGSVRQFNCTWALLTPSMARALEPADFPTLKTLALAGEAVKREDIDRWAPQVDFLMNGYGPSECTVITTVARCHTAQLDPANIGYTTGATCWIVDRDDHEKLVPIGAVGELLVEGPIVGRGYINNSRKTAEVFIDRPNWLLEIRPGSTGRVYKTGDLAMYEEDGSIRYMGRKDTQTKLRGQRMELGEVEYHLRRCFPEANDIAADIVIPTGEDNSSLLAAFLVPGGQQLPDREGEDSTGSEEWLTVPSEELLSHVQSSRAKLAKLLPGFMVPTAFLTISSMPLTISGKIDRRRLREIASSRTRQELQGYCGSDKGKRPPTTAAERAIQDLWVQILQIPSAEIGLDDNFWALGGDSIHAIRLAGAARREGLYLEVSEVWDHKNLEEMAITVFSREKCTTQDFHPFSHFPGENDRNQAIQLASRVCCVDASNIEDIYPCTTLQEGLASLIAKRSSIYTIIFEYELPLDIDVVRFRDSWNSTVEANPILRTRLVQSSSGEIYQTVIREQLPWDTLIHGQEVPEAWQEWKLGDRLVRPVLSHDSSTNRHYFTLVIHHVLTDGWALKLVLKQVEAAYRGENLLFCPFSPFIEYLSGNQHDSETFWKNRFSNLNATTCPTLPSPDYIPSPRRRTVAHIPAESDVKSDNITIPTKLKLAWGITLSQYTDSPDVVFGNTVTGRSAPVFGVEEMTGPTIATIPVRLQLNPKDTVVEALRKIDEDSISTLPFEQTGLQNISRMSPECAAACQFQNILIIQPEEEETELFSNFRDLCRIGAFTTHAIMLQCKLLDGKVEIEATFDHQVVSEIQMQRILNQMKHIFQQVGRFPGLLLRDLEVVSTEDLLELNTWNGNLQRGLNMCANDVIYNRCLAQPDAPAISAWDGNFTYLDLETNAFILAKHLAHRGVGPGVFVPLYFEKSRWTTIAMLGVMKAGGAFVLLDPSHPLPRLQGICQDADARLVITSEMNAEKAASLLPNPVVIGDSEKSWTLFPSYVRLVPATPDDPIYSVFTSGSTGKPKGVVVSHSTWYTSAEANRTSLYLDTQSRVLQFASYAFDISIADSLLTLLAGGCVCVPSNKDRESNLAKTITDFQVNWACLTPSIARILDPEKVTTLRKLILTGEAMTSEDVKLWAPHVHLLNVYGPAEVAILTSVDRDVREGHQVNNIGHSTSGVCWIVNPRDHNKLAPIGVVGELVVEGPNVSRGYLNEPEKTQELFVETPSWLRKFRKFSSTHVYKTGDLVRYTADGSMQYVGRKDHQIKLHGQRIELGEVEHYVKQHFPRASEAVVDVILLNGFQSPTLVAFVLQDRAADATQDSLFGDPDTDFQNDVATALSQLADAVPKYMLPTIFFPIEYLPLSHSGKLNRRELHDKAAALSGKALEQFTVGKATKQAPTTDTQRQLQQLFAEVLRIPASEIGVEDHFFRRGGDSILAMKLAALAQDTGCSITLGDIFNHPKLADLAQKINPKMDELDSDLAPFALVKDPIIFKWIMVELEMHGGVSRNEIEDVYPCTPLQEGMMALTAKSPGTYVCRFEVHLEQGIDVCRFQDAFNATMLANPILRTRITQTIHGSFQVVMRESPPWKIYQNEEDYCARSETPAIGPNQPLSYLELVAPENPSGHYRFILTLHHALYDGWSMPLIWHQFEQAFNGSTLQPRPFNGFIAYLSQLDNVDKFWRSQFVDLNAPIFPALPSSNYTPTPTGNLSHLISDTPAVSTGHTMSTAIRLAWSVTLSHYTDSDDVIFGSTVSGRSAPVGGIDRITGPTIVTVPFRVQLDPNASVENALSAVQNQVTAMIPYEHTGLQNISKLNSEAAAACGFQNQLGIQPGIRTTDCSLFKPVGGEAQEYSYGAFASYAFVIVCHLGDKDHENAIRVAVSYDPQIVGAAEAQRMVEHFEHVLRYIIQHPDQQLKTIPTTNSQEVQQLLEWNGTLPSSHEKCLHDLILEHSCTHPDALAISAWDGMLTYAELESLSAPIAQYLRERGVGRGSLVPVCFEKSKWCIIAVMAVHRAGAACVFIDPKHPQERIRQILEQTTPSTIVTSPSQSQIFMDNISKVVTVPLPNESIPETTLPDILESSATPEDPSFIIFTSGSTGKPKGIVMEHRNLSTSIRDHSGPMKVNQDTRALHFAAYAFDASIYEIFTTLVNGGCLCVPSESDRMNNLTGFMQDHQVNWALFVPSLIRSFLQPDQIPSLQTVIIGGEALTQEIVDIWASKLVLINAYGPAETTICAAGKVPERGWAAGTIGPITGGVGWVTLPSDSSRLAPIGAVGELVIEGPVVSRGYLNDFEKTAAAYISPPSWLTEFRKPGEEGPLYQSGDLVRYTDDGSIQFAGRKGTQVKLRGQRIELGEVEYFVKQQFSDATDAVAEVVIPATEGGKPTLMSFILNEVAENQTNGEEEDLFLAPDKNFLSQAHSATVKLRSLLPDYMVPAVFLQLSRLPRTSSDKLNRRLLREQAALLPLHQRRDFSTLKSSKCEPRSQQERTLQGLWAEVLKMSPEHIGADDDFFQLGGDSISAMKLVSLCRAKGLHIAVRSIFDHPILSELGEVAEKMISPVSVDEYCPGSLLGITDLKCFVTNLPGQPHHFKPEDVVDILPTTELQSHLIKANNVTYLRINLPMRIDPNRVEAACHAMVHHHSVLRTVFVPYQGNLIQVVLRDIEIEHVRLSSDGDIEELADTVCTQDCSSPIPFGSAHLKTFLFSRSESQHLLVIRTTHAQYDGQSLPLIFRNLAVAYNNEDFPPAGPDFSMFLRYREEQRTAERYQFWREYLQGSQMLDLKTLSDANQVDGEKEVVVNAMKQIPLCSPPEGITMASLVKAAWALVLAQLSGQRDIIFGHVFTGRDAPIENVDLVAAPLFTMVPIRVTIQPSWTVGDLLNHVQSQYTRTLPHAHVDFQYIRENTTPWTPETEISSVVTHQNAIQSLEFIMDGVKCPWTIWDDGIPSHFHVISYPVGEQLVVALTGSSKKVGSNTVNLMLDKLCTAISEFSESLRPLPI